MSNIYIKEPSTFGKVLMHTSMGDIDVELWSKEAPIACRNFVQLCMEGYYDNVIFHRVVPNFCVQGGDPTGTGQGGESIYGEPFKDEFHSRLRFVRRGLVAMANAGPDDNGSQFFFTLGPCNDLNKKHTIFGKVTGDTVYNLVRLGEVGTTDDERPINPPFIKWTKVLANPFDDIEPRVNKQKLEQEKLEAKKKKKSQMKATKDFKLLSFGEEAEEEEMETKQFDKNLAVKSKSMHDVANDPKLSSQPAVEVEEGNGEKRKHGELSGSEGETSGSGDENSDEEQKAGRMQRIKDKLKSKQTEKQPKKAKVDGADDKSGDESKMDKSEELKKESKRLAREILKSRRKHEIKPNQDDDKSSDSSAGEEQAETNPIYADFKQQQKKYRQKTSKNMEKGSSRESATLAMLSSFKTKMFSMREEAGWEDENHEGKEEDDGAGDNLEDDEDDSGWLLHRLAHSDELRDAKDMNREVNEDRFDLTDPRNPLNQRKRERSSKKHKDSRERSHRSERHRR